LHAIIFSNNAGSRTKIPKGRIKIPKAKENLVLINSFKSKQTNGLLFTRCKLLPPSCGIFLVLIVVFDVLLLVITFGCTINLPRIKISAAWS